MTAPVAWPAGVPKKSRRDGFAVKPPRTLLRSEMERGHKTRRVATGTPREYRIRIRMSWAELDLFETWYETTNGHGALPFLFPHPRTQVDKTCGFIPDNDGRAYALTPHTGRYWFVEFDMELFD